MAIEAYINFNGNCRQALEYYTDIFEIKDPKIMNFGDMPPNPEFVFPDEAKNLVMNAELNITGSNVMFSDTFPGSPFIVGNNISLVIGSKNMDEIKSLFNKLKEGGTVDMDLQETFWSKCYGSLTDKFGIGWQFNFDNGEMGM